jgi:hypothetical protein
MNHIDRCKKAQELGLRVCFRPSNSDTFACDAPGRYTFSATPDQYRIHPADEKAFEIVLQLEQDNATWRTRVVDTEEQLRELKRANDNKARLIQELRAQVEGTRSEANDRITFLTNKHNKQLQIVQDQIGVINSLHSRINSMKAPTAEDLLQQLCQKLGPNSTITIVTSGV